jgi:hypothetical protein
MRGRAWRFIAPPPAIADPLTTTLALSLARNDRVNNRQKPCKLIIKFVIYIKKIKFLIMAALRHSWIKSASNRLFVRGRGVLSRPFSAGAGTAPERV